VAARGRFGARVDGQVHREPGVDMGRQLRGVALAGEVEHPVRERQRLRVELSASGPVRIHGDHGTCAAGRRQALCARRPAGNTADVDVMVVGQIVRDLVLRVDGVPDAGSTTPVRERIEVLGGKGANQAVALAQLGAAPALLGVVGDDRHATEVLERAGRDGIHTGAVVHRAGTRTGLIVDVVDGDGRWRYLEDVFPEVLLTTADVDAAEPVLADAATVVVQLQQPLDACCLAADHARRAGATVVVDGAPPDPSARDDLLARADVLRADDTEAALWAGAEVGSATHALRVARALLGAGPRMVVLGAGAEGNVVAWPDGEAVLPLGDARVVDTTGGGDAFTAGIVAALDRGPYEAARWGSAAAALTVGHLGGRPALSVGAVREQLAEQARRSA
jgi:ribokinase